MTTAEFLSRLSGVKPTASGGWDARCPGHEDNKASLSVTEGEAGRILLHCFAGCSVESIVGALDCKLADLFPPGAKDKRNGKPRIVAAYGYHDENGTLLFQCVRFAPKDFRQRRPDPSKPGEWIWNLEGTRRVLYRLPELKAAIAAASIIYISEGEKDVDALAKHGLAATCNPMGAGKWSPEHTETLRAAADRIVVIADKDSPGRRHAQTVAGSLHGDGKNVTLIELPDRNGHPVKDAADWFGAGGTANELRAIVEAAQEFTPTSKLQPRKSGSASEYLDTGEESASALQSELSPADDFGKVTAWIRGEIVSLLIDKEMPQATKRSRIAQKVVEALNKVGRLYFNSDLRDFDSAMFFDGHRKRLERIRSDAFGAWLSDWLCINRAETLFRSVMAQVETAALSSPDTTGIVPESFWASRPGAIFLSNSDGTAIRITGNGVQLVDNGTDGVLFAAGRTLQPWTLAEPRDPFVTCSIFRNVRCSASHAPDLLRLWLYSLPSNPPCKPPLCIAGDIGSGKTRLAKATAEFYGLPFVAAKVEESEESNFWPSMDAGGIFTLDNADTKCRWLADSLANAATDGCSQRRKLYTNSETVILRARAWLCVTTANATFANDSGLADRLLLVRMARRDNQDTSDGALTDEILANRDAGLSHVAETLRVALADTASAPVGLNARHPDFAKFAVRIGRAIGREAEAVAALRAAEADKSAFCLENDSIGAALLAYLRDAQTFTGTAAELAPKLCEFDAELKDKLSPKRLGKRLAALWPHLQKSLTVAKREIDRKGFTQFRLEVADYAEFQTPFSLNPPREQKHREFIGNTKTNSANPANPETSKDLADAALEL